MANLTERNKSIRQQSIDAIFRCLEHLMAIKYEDPVNIGSQDGETGAFFLYLNGKIIGAVPVCDILTKKPIFYVPMEYSLNELPIHEFSNQAIMEVQRTLEAYISKINDKPYQNLSLIERLLPSHNSHK